MKHTYQKRKKQRRLSAKGIIILILSAVIVILSAAVMYLASDGGKNVLSGIGKISTAKLKNGENRYSYYDDNGGALLTPYRDNGCGTGMMCEIVVPYAEATGAGNESNRSDPLISPLVRGTVDRVISVAGTDENPIYCLESGVKVNASSCQLTENGYLLPENTLTVDSCSATDNGVLFKLSSDWAVPVQVLTEPQSYFTGYQQREFNVESFTGEYLDIRFARTGTLEGKLDFSGSDIVKRYEWMPDGDGGVLRLYFQKTGVFYGYSYSLDRNGRFVFLVKRSIVKDTSPTVMLDPGHGGSDPGAASLSSEYESTLTLDIAEKTASLLAEKGVRVLMTRRENSDVSLDERIAMARKYSPSLYVSIHCDSSETPDLYGTHTFYYKNYSQPLAQSIHSRLAAVYGELYAADAQKAAGSNREIKFYPFAVTRIEECPSVLVECGYLSNPEDCAFLCSEAGRLRIAAAIAEGICEQLNVAW